jgi:hypothetical protein
LRWKRYWANSVSQYEQNSGNIALMLKWIWIAFCLVWAVTWLWPYASSYGDGTQADANRVVAIGLAPTYFGWMLRRVIHWDA